MCGCSYVISVTGSHHLPHVTQRKQRAKCTLSAMCALNTVCRWTFHSEQLVDSLQFHVICTMQVAAEVSSQNCLAECRPGAFLQAPSGLTVLLRTRRDGISVKIRE